MTSQERQAAIAASRPVDRADARLVDALRVIGRSRLETQHDNQDACPECGKDTNVAIVTLVYTFEVCKCGRPDYDHLIEQLWHRACFVGSASDDA